MEEMRFDRYYRYEELTGFLQAWAAAYPQLCRLESIGQSHEGRDIWAMILTNSETGPDDEKPAFWADGNIHATEVSASTAVLYLIHKLLTGYGRDDKVTYALNTRAIYAVPRLNPDGAEWALADTPRYIRSSTRAYPRAEELPGLHKEDVDGDGRLLQMRVPDRNGAWKVHPQDPRLLVPREPDEPPGGTIYHLLPEGLIRDYDGVTVEVAPALQGLDLNRQFPVFWEPKERGAGAYPGSEPEAAAAMRFIGKHENITGTVSFHTFSGVHLRASSKGPDAELPTQDLFTFRKIGAKAEELTGYPAVSTYEEFQYDPKEYIRGAFSDWTYEHLGLYGWTTEIWSIQRAAGVTDYKYIDWFREHPVEHDLALLHWNDEALDGKGFVDWYPFEHPQLGSIELGGWDIFNTWRNPPQHLLEAEIAPLADFVIFSSLISPRLALHSIEQESTGQLHHLRFVVENTGWLPTNITQRALEQKVVQPVEVMLDLPDGARLVTGKLRTELGQLKGRDHLWQVPLFDSEGTKQRALVEWVIDAPAGAIVEVTAAHKRAGTVRKTITLGDR